MGIQAPFNKQGKQIRERILLYGPPKVGKTHQYMNIAKWHQELDSDAKFYAISTDTSFEVLLMNPEFENLENIDYTDVVRFQDYVDAARKYVGLMRPHDWLSVDLMSDAWGAVQDEYAKAEAKNMGTTLEDMGDLWATSGNTDSYPIEGWEWQRPNARFRVLANNYILRCPGHVLVVCGQKELMQDSGSGKSGEKQNVKEMFGHLGVKPTGQKEDPFRYHSIIHVDSAGLKQQKMATAGERFGYREWLGKRMSNGMAMDQRVEDFFLEYLVGIARWKM